MKGFTLLELLVVIVVIGVISLAALSLTDLFSSRTALTASADHVRMSVAFALQEAVNRHRGCFVKFEEIAVDGARTGVMTFYDDTNKNKTLDAEDRPVDGKPVELLKFVYFARAPQWARIDHIGNAAFPDGYATVSAEQYRKGLASDKPVGDIVLAMEHYPEKVYIDLTPTGGVCFKTSEGPMEEVPPPSPPEKLCPTNGNCGEPYYCAQVVSHTKFHRTFTCASCGVRIGSG